MKLWRSASLPVIRPNWAVIRHAPMVLGLLAVVGGSILFLAAVTGDQSVRGPSSGSIALISAAFVVIGLGLFRRLRIAYYALIAGLSLVLAWLVAEGDGMPPFLKLGAVLIYTLFARSAFTQSFSFKSRVAGADQDPAAREARRALAEQRLRTVPGTRPESVLGFADDKAFFFADDGQSFLIFARTGSAWLALGAPVGPEDHWPALYSQFRRDAEASGKLPGIYAAPPEALPALRSASFKTEKIGENAILDLQAFSLRGNKREALRRGHRKLKEREGGSFEMWLPPHDRAQLEKLAPISQRWLDQRGGTEKRFSLGRFEPDYLDNCPIGVAYINGEPVALGSLMLTADKGWAGIDLMRFDDRLSITNTMDFLLVEMILWAQNEGYRRFDLSMAPLAGVGTTENSKLFAKLAQSVYRRGERFYSFQGVRRFKQKFDPEWEPRYVAGPSAVTAPLVLAKAAVLTNGRVKLRGHRSKD